MKKKADLPINEEEKEDFVKFGHILCKQKVLYMIYPQSILLFHLTPWHEHIDYDYEILINNLQVFEM